jgi:hypothetical protein
MGTTYVPGGMMCADASTTMFIWLDLITGFEHVFPRHFFLTDIVYLIILIGGFKDVFLFLMDFILGWYPMTQAYFS